MASAVANRWRGIAGKCLVFGLALLPLGLLVEDIVNANLGPDPGQVIAEALGIAAFQLLLVTLAITPLKKVTGWSGWLRYRRMLGLFAFFYAALHLLAFLQLILGWMDLWATFTKRLTLLPALPRSWRWYPWRSHLPGE